MIGINFENLLPNKKRTKIETQRLVYFCEYLLHKYTSKLCML